MAAWEEISAGHFSKREKRVTILAPPVRFREFWMPLKSMTQKNPEIYRGIHPERSPEILSILSVADDLEAIGVIGIYRYSEIYLKRGISMVNLGCEHTEECNREIQEYLHGWATVVMISRRSSVSNMTGWFHSLTCTTGNCCRFPFMMAKLVTGHVGVINYIRRLSVEGNTRPEIISYTNRAGEPEVKL